MNFKGNRKLISHLFYKTASSILKPSQILYGEYEPQASILCELWLGLWRQFYGFKHVSQIPQQQWGIPENIHTSPMDVIGNPVENA